LGGAAVVASGRPGVWGPVGTPRPGARPGTLTERPSGHLVPAPRPGTSSGSLYQAARPGTLTERPLGTRSRHRPA